MEALRSARIVTSSGGASESQSQRTAGEKVHRMFRAGEWSWFGGSLSFQCSASLAKATDVWTPEAALAMGPRQLKWSAAICEAFARSNVAAATAAALNHALNVDKTKALNMVEQALVRTQSFEVTVLSLRVVRDIVRAAQAIRGGGGQGPGGLRDPNDYLDSLSDFPDKYRVDVLTLLEVVLNVAPGVDVWICSVTAEGTVEGVCQASDQFTTDLKKEKDLDITRIATKDDLFATLRPSTLSCYWCGRPAVLKKLLVCGKCWRIDYCSPECQRADWKHFHKGQECRDLCREGTAKPFMTRYDQFRRLDRPVASFPVPLRRRFKGDLLKIYLVGLDDKNCISKDTAPPPRPWRFEPRESLAAHTS